FSAMVGQEYDSVAGGQLRREFPNPGQCELEVSPDSVLQVVHRQRRSLTNYLCEVVFLTDLASAIALQVVPGKQGQGFPWGQHQHRGQRHFNPHEAADKDLGQIENDDWVHCDTCRLTTCSPAPALGELETVQSRNAAGVR